MTKAAKAAALALLLGGTSSVFADVVRGRALAPIVTTTPGTTSYLSACGFYPPVDPGVTVTTTVVGESITSASVTFGPGDPFIANDTLAVNPDPFSPCSFDTSLPPAELCGPCPGLTVTGEGTTALAIIGVGNATAYSSCLRRVVYRSVAFGGEEGLGDRTVVFTVTSGPGLSAAASKTITVLPADTLACSALLSSVSPTLRTTLPPEGPSPYPLGYDSDCIGTACDALLFLVPAGLTVTMGSSGVIGRAQIFFNLFSRGPPPGIFLPSEDRVGILPDPAVPGSTASDPCPGLGFRVLFGTTPGTPGFGLFAGVEVYGPASPEAYTACLRRAAYWNIAASPAAATLGLRPTAVRAFSVRTAFSESFFGLTLPVVVLPPDGTCTLEPCLKGPTDAEVSGGSGPGATATVTPLPTLAPGASSSSSPGSSASHSAAPSRAPGSSASRTPFNSNLLPPDFRRVTWYSHGDCSTDSSALSRFGPNAAFSQNPGSSNIRHRSVVVVRDGTCNFVPSAPANLSYIVSCSGSGRATISFCTSNCGFCPYSYSLQGDGSQCWPAAPGYGAAALRVDCGRQSLTDLNPFGGDAYLRWIEQPVCANDIERATHMVVPQNVCNTVPGATTAANSGYRLRCDDSGNGSGTFEVCDNNCSTCRTSTRFAGIAQCNPNPPETGSASVRFHCGPTVVGAQREENGGSASGALSTESSLITAAGTILVGAAAAAAGLGFA